MTFPDRVTRALVAAFVLGLAASITLSETVLVVLAVGWLVRLATGRAERRLPLLLPFLAFVVVSLVASALSARPLASLRADRNLLLIVTFYVVLDALRTARAGDRFVAWLALAVAVVSALGVVQVVTCGRLTGLARLPVLGDFFSPKCQRAHGFFSIYMTLGGVLSLVLLATLPRLTLAAGRARAWRLPAWLVTAVAFALTYVRGAWVGFLAGVLVVAGLARRGRLLMGAGVLVLVVGLLLVPGVRRRAVTIADPNDPTAHERLLMWRSGFRMAHDRPLTGVGPGQVKYTYGAYAAPEVTHRARSHLHDTPIQILVERGVPGFLAWAWIFTAFFVRAGGVLRRLPAGSVERALVAGSVAAIAGFLVGGLTEYNFGDSEVVLVAYAVMALPFVVERDAAGRGGIAGSGV